MFKVGDRVEWCLDGRFDLYEDSSDPSEHDFGEVLRVTGHGVRCEWESDGEEQCAPSYHLRKDSSKEPTYTKTQIKSFLETLRTEEDEEFTSEREWASEIFDKLEAFVNKPTQDEEGLKAIELKALELLKSRGYRVEK